MLNLIQHLIKSMNYQTLKRVQGDRKSFAWERWKKVCKNILTKVDRI